MKKMIEFKFIAFVLFLTYSIGFMYIFEMYKHKRVFTPKMMYAFIFFPLILLFKLVLCELIIINFLVSCLLMLFFVKYFDSPLFKKINKNLKALI